MFIEFFFELRRQKVPVATQEWLLLMRALSLGLHDSSLDGFYHLARALCVKDVAQFDAFDAAFLSVFRGVTAASIEVTDELRRWLTDPKLRGSLTEEELALLKELDLDELRRLYEQRLKEQKERHDGGNKWIGTGGTSPFGNSGKHPTGMRVGEGGQRSAMQVAAERRFREYRTDTVLDVRAIDVALRTLRDLGRDGAEDELDLDATVDETAKNAGDLELVIRPPQRNRVKVVLLMDVGGSMDPHSMLVSRLFTAASRSGRFARFRSFYFHNCVYESVYKDAQFREDVPLAELFATSDRHEKLVIVGDGAMHPAELLEAGGAIYYYARNQYSRIVTPGVDWMRQLAEHFPRSAWLNPEYPESSDPSETGDDWRAPTVQILSKIFAMYPLSISGIERAVRYLVRGVGRP